MPMINKRSDPVFTKTTKPKSARPKAINPNLSLDIYSPPDIETSPERKRGLPEQNYTNICSRKGVLIWEMFNG
jgi:hypothetical protein